MYSKQKALNFGNYIPNDKVLNKKVPENPKYKHVKPAIDTGKNVRKHIDELKEKQKNCIYKKDEVFKRIKVSAFIKLALACVEEAITNESDMVHQPSNTDVPKAPELPEKRGMANVLMGVGELDLASSRKKVQSATVKPAKFLPYLLLDVRDRDAFAQCHIITAKHYPSAMLSRSIGYEIEDMKFYKNSPTGIIILYDDDETIATRVATTLVERGYENVYLLTGGLKLALDICPHGLTTFSQVLSPVHMLSHGAASHTQKCYGKEYFTHDDVAAIEHYVYSNRGSSISSRSSSQSTMVKPVRYSHRNCLETTSASSCSSTLSRRASSCSSSTRHLTSVSSRLSQTHTNCTKNTEQTHFKPTIDEKTKMLKRAPWK